MISEFFTQERSSSNAPTAPSLRRDEDGAVMVMGLFFAMLLIAAMWSMKGLGDAVVFRQRMQEGADHEVYAAAVVHARGMNLVAALNVLMRVITMIWLVMSVLRDLLSIAMVILGACSFVPFVGGLCASLLAVATNARSALNTARDAYEASVISIGLPAISGVGTAAALAYPWYGSAKAAGVGHTYDASGIAFGSSHVPGLAFDVEMDSMFDGAGDKNGGKSCTAAARGAGTDRQSGVSDEDKDDEIKLGLPVVNEKNDKLCELAADKVSDYFPPGIGDILSWVVGAFTDAGNYCSGNPWDTKIFGWKRMYKPAKNGSAYMQIWDISLPGAYEDGKSSSKVALGEGPKKGLPKAKALAKNDDKPSLLPFFAQAEFFFDCKGPWKGGDCGNDQPDHFKGSFEMRWRARLRPVSFPKTGPFNLRDAVGLAEHNHQRFASDGKGPDRDRVHDAGKALQEGLSTQAGDAILH